MMIVFTRPQFLLLLLVIPLLIFFYIFSLKSIKKRAVKFANFEAITRIKGVEIFSKNLVMLYINIIIVFLVVFSISGVSVIRDVSASQVSFVLAIDSSGSMVAEDIFPNRIEAAKKASIDFLKMVPEKTRIGIISFSGTAFIEQELTEDKDLLKKVIKDLNVKMIGGTDILGAITHSTNLLMGEEAKTIVLISDGQANINTLQDVIDYSNNNQVRIHTLGIGTSEGGTDNSGAVFKLSEDTLKTIAQNTDGKYYHVEDVEDFYYSLSEIVDINKKRAVYDFSLYFMIGALFLLIVSFVLTNTRYRILP